MRYLLGLVLALVIGGAAAVATGAVQVSTAPAAATPAAPGTVPPAIQQQLQVVDQALARARQAGAPVAVTLTFAEADLQSSVASAFPQSLSGISFSDPVVRLRDGQLTLELNASASILRSRATIVATPVVSAGRPAVRIDSLSLGALPVPDQLRSSASSQLASAISGILPAKLAVTALVVGQGTLTVTGVANP